MNTRVDDEELEFLPSVASVPGRTEHEKKKEQWQSSKRGGGGESYARAVLCCIIGLVLGVMIGRRMATSPTSSSGGGVVSIITKEAATNNNMVDDDDGDDEGLPWPRVAWLMSFPNSGTSYTIGLVKSSTLHHTASNYGEHNVDKNTGVSIPVYDNDISPYGPFWSDPWQERISVTNETITFPDRGYLLTKTHCGGRCLDCEPSKYLETQHYFLIRCLQGKFVEKDEETGDLVHVKGHYDANLVKRAIHLIRNPFNNVVARFHLHLHHKPEYTSDREGFRDFCEYENDKYEDAEKGEGGALLDEQVLSMITNVPCHAEFLRYVRWHNLAFTVTRNLRLPTMVLHYERYEYEFDETLEELLTFLKQDRVGTPKEFIPGKSYLEYYTEEEKSSVKAMMKEVSYIETWESIERYFMDIVDDD